jgi:seryl-tRNA synthetase
MHDINFIRNNPEDFDSFLELRFLEPHSKKILELDKSKREILTSSQNLRSQRKNISSQFASSQDSEKLKLQEEVHSIKEQIDSLEKKLLIIDEEIHLILSSLPNLPDPEVPIAKDEDGNKLIKTIGEIPSFDFNPLAHYDLGENLQMMDFDQAAKVSGSRFVYLKKDFAKLERSIANFMLDKHTTDFGYTEVNPPNLVKDAAAFGTGQLPKFSDDLFKTNSDHWLIPTAEVPLTNLHLDSITNEKNLPARYTAWTSCYRLEAGSAGRDTRGMIRQHQFSKVELVSLVKPEESNLELERMLGCATSILNYLKLSYRVMLLSSGDMGFSAKKTYDIEVWLPSESKYREISSCSNCGDFQARRMNAKYKSKDGNVYLHTLNGSGLAVGRTLIAIVENYQNKDGSITVPDVLVSYMGGKKIINLK